MRIGMIPTYSGTKWEADGNPHLKHLEEVISQHGWEIIPLSPEKIGDRNYLVNSGCNIIYLHWPFSFFNADRYGDVGKLSNYARIFEHKLNHAGRHCGFLPALGALCARRLHALLMQHRAEREIGNIVSGLKESNLPVVWEIHDIRSHHVVEGTYLDGIDRELHKQLYALCAAIVIHEKSCLVPIMNAYGAPRDFAVAPLGSYDYGPHISRADARSLLGIQCRGKIVAYIGTVRPNRNPLELLKAFVTTAGANDLLLVAGMGVRNCLTQEIIDKRVVVYDGFLPQELVRNIFCAADFVVNDARNYLTSAVIRTAMCYGVPVIVRPYGSALDMAEGASIHIQNEAVGDALLKAFQITDEEYEKMQHATLNRNMDRTWAIAGERINNLLRKIMFSR